MNEAAPGPRNPLREAWEAGAPAIGVMNGIPFPILIEQVARFGFDFIMHDTQHGGITIAGLAELLQAADLGGTATLVRVPWNHPPDIMRVLDLGAVGVVVPMVSNREDAIAAASATRYPPAGIRSNGQIRGGFGGNAAANREVVCLVMIETAEGVANASEIMAVDGVDGVFIGPVDLSLSLGIEVDYSLQHPELVRAMDTIRDACLEHGKIAGTYVFDANDTGDWVRKGYHFLTVGSTNGFVWEGSRAQVAQVQEVRKELGLS